MQLPSVVPLSLPLLDASMTRVESGGLDIFGRMKRLGSEEASGMEGLGAGFAGPLPLGQARRVN